MQQYLVQRLLLVIPTLLLAGTMIFAMTRYLPGDAAALMLGAEGDSFTEENLQLLRDRLGLNRPLTTQFVSFWSDTLQGDLGTSIWTKKPVLDEITRRLPVTMELLFIAMIFGWIWGVGIGMLSAIKPDSWIDQLARSIAILGLSLPIFWVGILAIVIPARLFRWTPLRGYHHIWENPSENLALMIFPAIILGVFVGAPVMRLMRTTMLEVLHQDYVRTARAKGLGEAVVLRRHVVKNALMPVVTLMGVQIVLGIGGIVILEVLFNIPGMGQLLIAQALPKRDYPLIQGIVLVIALSTTLINLAVDLSYGFLDPRVRV